MTGGWYIREIHDRSYGNVHYRFVRAIRPYPGAKKQDVSINFWRKADAEAFKQWIQENQEELPKILRHQLGGQEGFRFSDLWQMQLIERYVLAGGPPPMSLPAMQALLAAQLPRDPEGDDEGMAEELEADGEAADAEADAADLEEHLFDEEVAAAAAAVVQEAQEYMPQLVAAAGGNPAALWQQLHYSALPGLGLQGHLQQQMTPAAADGGADLRPLMGPHFANAAYASSRQVALPADVDSDDDGDWDDGAGTDTMKQQPRNAWQLGQQTHSMPWANPALKQALAPTGLTYLRPHQHSQQQNMQQRAALQPPVLLRGAAADLAAHDDDEEEDEKTPWATGWQSMPLLSQSLAPGSMPRDAASFPLDEYPAGAPTAAAQHHQQQHWLNPFSMADAAGGPRRNSPSANVAARHTQQLPIPLPNSHGHGHLVEGTGRALGRGPLGSSKERAWRSFEVGSGQGQGVGGGCGIHVKEEVDPSGAAPVLEGWHMSGPAAQQRQRQQQRGAMQPPVKGSPHGTEGFNMSPLKRLAAQLQEESGTVPQHGVMPALGAPSMMALDRGPGGSPWNFPSTFTGHHAPVLTPGTAPAHQQGPRGQPCAQAAATAAAAAAAALSGHRGASAGGPPRPRRLRAPSPEPADDHLLGAGAVAPDQGFLSSSMPAAWLSGGAGGALEGDLGGGAHGGGTGNTRIKQEMGAGAAQPALESSYVMGSVAQQQDREEEHAGFAWQLLARQPDNSTLTLHPSPQQQQPTAVAGAPQTNQATPGSASKRQRRLTQVPTDD